MVMLGGEDAAPADDFAGIPIAIGVRAFPIDARPIEIVDATTSDVWTLTDPHQIRWVVAEWIPRLKSIGAFVWLDPPRGIDPEVVAARLREAGVPVRVKPRETADAILAEVASVVAASADQTTRSMREVVTEMADEVDLPDADTDYLHEILDVAMTGAGL